MAERKLHDIPFAPMEPGRLISEQPTCQLRWLAGRLQQGWLITEFIGSSPSSFSTEWRDVPTEPTGGDHG